MDPGEMPNLVNLFGNAMETAKIEWQHNCQAYDMHRNVNTALITVFKQALNPEIIAGYQHPRHHGFSHVLQPVHTHLRPS
jgi:hypothetical protein